MDVVCHSNNCKDSGDTCVWRMLVTLIRIIDSIDNKDCFKIQGWHNTEKHIYRNDVDR